jgi:autoinducer 2 (AI-2) kinase
MWVQESSSGDMGNAYQWLKEATMGGGDEAYGEMDELAATAPLGSGGASSYLGPGRMDVSRLGMRQGGMLFPVPLTLGGFGRPHLVRATLEGFAFALRANIEQLEEMTGLRPAAIAVGGGMTRSSTCVRILVDVLDRPIRLGADPRATAVGAALCARLALDEFSSLREGIVSLEADVDIFEPDPLKSSEYTDLYGAWLEAGDNLSRMPI